MSKSRGRFLSELLNSTGFVKRDRSDLAGADGTIDLDSLPTIPNSQLEHSSVSIAGHTLSLGGSLTLNTADIGEHASYLYYTDARVGSYLTTNSYATQSYVTTAISNLVDTAPSTLDTLNELAAALGDDANFSTTVTNSIATKWTQDNTKISNWDTAYSWGDHASAGYLTGNQTITLSGDVSGSGTTSIVVTVADDSHNHVISNVDGLQTALDGKLSTTGKAADADLLDGQNGSYYDQSQFTGASFYSSNSGTRHASLDSSTSNNIGYISGSNPSSHGDGSIYTAAYSSSWVSQIFSDYRSSNLWTRTRNNGTWQSWYQIWHSGNDGSGSGLDADTCDGQHLGTGSNVTHAQIHASDWFRNTQSAEGMYNTPNQTHFYSAGPNYWHINTTSGQAYGALVLYDRYNASQGHSTGRKGYLYWDASGFGLLSSDGSWAYRHNNTYADIYGTIRQDGSNTVWHAGNDGSGSGLDADLLDGINSGSFLRSDSNDTLSANITLNGDLVGNGDGYRHLGLFGNYNSYRIHHMWSMGTAYRVHSNGSNFGNLYGFAYTYHNRVYTSNAMANHHQIVWCQNGTPNAALGTNIWTSGNVTAYSDIRVKTNLEVIPNALKKVQQLNGYTFDRTDIQYDTEGNPTVPPRQTGVVAQEVLKVLPEAVTGDEESHYNVAYGNMVGLLIEAIKELKSEVDDLKSQLEKK